MDMVPKTDRRHLSAPSSPRSVTVTQGIRPNYSLSAASRTCLAMRRLPRRAPIHRARPMSCRSWPAGHMIAKSRQRSVVSSSPSMEAHDRSELTYHDVVQRVADDTSFVSRGRAPRGEALDPFAVHRGAFERHPAPPRG